MTNGYVYVASRYEKYATSAEYSALTLKDYYPEANITLFTQDHLVQSRFTDVFDNIITKDCPDSSRAKLWALPQTPYKKTLYIDADSAIQHEDIANVFDLLTDEHDILITKIRKYNGVFHTFPGGELIDHCGVFLYNDHPRTLTFMQQWWELWQKQKSGEWTWDTDLYPEDLRPWDQWSYWWLQNKTDYRIRRGYFPDPDARWNFVNGYRPDECPKEDIVIYHHTVDLKENTRWNF